jgi:predicted ribosomally synthesized peptide with SipW-like signal peptide
MSTETPNEDYVLVHKSKVRISRARKFIMGTMAVGAVAAIAGAGTFASFSASTDNDATFQTATVILTNKTNTGANTCWSSNQDNASSPSLDADLDANGTTCDNLLSANLVPGTTYTTYLKLSNQGNQTGTLKLFGAAGACVGSINDNNGTNEVQKLVIANATGGDYTLTFDGQTTAAIAYNDNAAAVQAALVALSNVASGDIVVSGTPTAFTLTFGTAYANTQVPQIVADGTGLTGTGPTATMSTTTEGLSVVNAGSLATSICSKIQLSVAKVDDISGTNPTTCYIGSGGNDCPTPGAFSDVPVFGSAISLGSLAPAANSFVKVVMKLPHNAANTQAGCVGNANQQFGTNGIGCDNPLMNAKALMSLRWQLQSA